MNRIFFLAALVAAATSASGNDQVRQALDSVMTSNFTTNNVELLVAEECGLPPALLASSSFSNLVSVVRSEIDSCPVSFACELTNRVPRRVFIEAVIRCGVTTYRDVVVNWFGGDVSSTVAPELMEDFVAPTRTSMEGYFIDHYNEPEIRNVWLNIKSRFAANEDNKGVRRIDRVLSGVVKAFRESMQSLESR